MTLPRVPSALVRPLRTVVQSSALSSKAVAPIVTSDSYRKSLLNMNPTEVTCLSNGLHVCSEYIDTPTATIGLWIDAGTRWENEQNNGVAHFLEHLVFKGTANRSQHELEIEVENMGAHLNAYTSREQTVYYAKCFAKDVDRSMDMLADILQNPRLEEGAIDRERHVILREMQEVETNLQEVIFDHLHAVAFQGTPLSFNILGPTENIKSISRADLLDYITKHYQPKQIYLAAAGGVDHAELVKLAEKHFGDMKTTHTHPFDYPPARYTGSHMKNRDDSMELAHVAIAVEGCSWTNPDYFALMVANTLVGNWNKAQGGGKTLPSKFARKIHDLGHPQSYMAFNTCYKDTGLWGLYGVCEPNDDAVRIFLGEVQAEWRRLYRSVSPGEVQRAKNLLKTLLLAQCDGTTAVCEDIGRQMLTYGRRISLAEIDARIEAVTPDVLRRVVGEFVYDKDPVLVGIGATEGMPDYTLTKIQQSSPMD